jgi:hypothetical protein
MILARLEVDPVTRPQFFNRTSLAQAEADPLGDKDRLSDRMGVPRRAGPRR